MLQPDSEATIRWSNKAGFSRHKEAESFTAFYLRWLPWDSRWRTCTCTPRKLHGGGAYLRVIGRRRDKSPVRRAHVHGNGWFRVTNQPTSTFWTVGGSRRTQSKPTRTRWEHANMQTPHRNDIDYQVTLRTNNTGSNQIVRKSHASKQTKKTKIKTETHEGTWERTEPSATKHEHTRLGQITT